MSVENAYASDGGTYMVHFVWTLGMIRSPSTWYTVEWSLVKNVLRLQCMLYSLWVSGLRQVFVWHGHCQRFTSRHLHLAAASQPILIERAWRNRSGHILPCQSGQPLPAWKGTWSRPWSRATFPRGREHAPPHEWRDRALGHPTTTAVRARGQQKSFVSLQRRGVKH